MKPLTNDSFKCEKIRAVSSDLKSVDDFNYTSVKFEYNGEAVPPLRINGSFRLFRHKNSKGPIYLLSINCNEALEEFFESLRDVIANETCRLIPKANGKKLNPDSFELVKSSKHGCNVYAKIYTKTYGSAKCKVSGLVEMADESRKRVPIPSDQLIDESFEGSCILRLYHAYVGSTCSISISVEEILVTDRKLAVLVSTMRRINIYLMDKCLRDLSFIF